MKHKVITKPEHFGCGCSPVPDVVLRREETCGVGFGAVSLEIDGEIVWRDDDDEMTVRELEDMFKDKIESAECSLLTFDTPLHDETYEYDKETGQWFLVRQGRGFA